MLPVGSLSLNHLSPDWAGEIHIVIPVEPVAGFGLAAGQSVEFQNYLCRSNWFGYLVRDGRLELACDFRIFHKAYYAENPPKDAMLGREVPEVESHYAQTREQFAKRATHFQQHGWLCANPENWDGSQPEPEPGDIMRASLVQDLGGVSYHGNWSNMEDFPLSRYPDQYEDRGTTYACDRVLPQTEDGRDFSYIGKVEMWNYIDHTNGMLVLFYDPQQQAVLTTIDWT